MKGGTGDLMQVNPEMAGVEGIQPEVKVGTEQIWSLWSFPPLSFDNYVLFNPVYYGLFATNCWE